MLGGLAGASPAELRIRGGARKCSTQYPGIKDPGHCNTAPGARPRARRSWRPMIQKFGKQIDGVWCDSGLECSGSIGAFVAAGYKDGEIPPQTGGDLNAMYKLAVHASRCRCAASIIPAGIGGRSVDVILDVHGGQVRCQSPRGDQPADGDLEAATETSIGESPTIYVGELCDDGPPRRRHHVDWPGARTTTPKRSTPTCRNRARRNGADADAARCGGIAHDRAGRPEPP